MSKSPEIRIYFSWLLYYGESQTLAGKNKLDSYEQFEEWTENYRREWKKYEVKIIPALQNVLGVNFYLPVIDVACAPYFIPKSDPLIMNYYNSSDQFVDALTHELCHVLLTDNNIVRLKDAKPKIQLFEEWQKLFGVSDDFNYIVHIPVNALCKYIYLDILKQPVRLTRDLDTVKTFENAEAYVKAWKYVEEHDYKKIIEDLKMSYNKAAK